MTGIPSGDDCAGSVITNEEGAVLIMITPAAPAFCRLSATESEECANIL